MIEIVRKTWSAEAAEFTMEVPAGDVQVVAAHLRKLSGVGKVFVWDWEAGVIWIAGVDDGQWAAVLEWCEDYQTWGMGEA